MKNNQSSPSKKEVESVFALYLNGEYKKAIDSIKALNIKYPNQPLLFNLIGACYKELGELAGAAKMFEVAVTLNPKYAEAFNNIGNAKKKLSKIDLAIESYEKAIECHDSKDYQAGWSLAKDTTIRHMQVIEGFSIE